MFSMLMAAVVLFAGQDKDSGSWVSLDRDIAGTARDVTGVVIYDVHDLANWIVDSSPEPDPKQKSHDERLEDLVRTGWAQPVTTATRTKFVEGETPVSEPFDPVREARLARATAQLAALIKENLEPPFDPNLHSVTAMAPSGFGQTVTSLAVVGTAAQQKWIKKFLTLSNQTTDLVRIDSRWISGPKGSFEKLGLEGSSVLPNKEQFEQFLAVLEADRKGNGQFDQLLAPSLLIHNLQRANVSTIDQIAYIKEWHVAFVLPGPQEIADPVIETIDAGETLEVRPVRVAQDLYRLSLDIRHVAVAQPIPTKKVRVSVAPGGEAEIGLPVVTRVNFTADVKLASDGAVVLVTPLDDKKDLALIVKLSPVPDASVTEPPEHK